MAMQELTPEQIDTLAETEHPLAGFAYPRIGLQPYYHWLIRTLHRLGESSAGWLRVGVDDSSHVAVRVTPGGVTINGQALHYAGGVVDLGALNNDTALLWLYDADGDATVGAGAASAGWPTTAHVKLAQVTLDAGRITQVLDLRSQSIFSPSRVDPVNDLTQTISDPPAQAEVQAIQDKLNELLGALRAAGLLGQ